MSRPVIKPLSSREGKRGVCVLKHKWNWSSHHYMYSRKALMLVRFTPPHDWNCACNVVVMWIIPITILAEQIIQLMFPTCYLMAIYIYIYIIIYKPYEPKPIFRLFCYINQRQRPYMAISCTLPWLWAPTCCYVYEGQPIRKQLA